MSFAIPRRISNRKLFSGVILSVLFLFVFVLLFLVKKNSDLQKEIENHSIKIDSLMGANQKLKEYIDKTNQPNF